MLLHCIQAKWYVLCVFSVLGTWVARLRSSSWVVSVLGSISFLSVSAAPSHIWTLPIHQHPFEPSTDTTSQSARSLSTTNHSTSSQPTAMAICVGLFLWLYWLRRESTRHYFEYVFLRSYWLSVSSFCYVLVRQTWTVGMKWEWFDAICLQTFLFRSLEQWDGISTSYPTVDSQG